MMDKYLVESPLLSLEELAETFNDDYYYDDNFTLTAGEPYEMEICSLKHHIIDEVAQAFMTALSIPGIFTNFVVAFVMLVLGEYKLSGGHWFTMQMFLTNTLFLIAVFLEKINEHHHSWIMGNFMCQIDRATALSASAAAVIFLALANFISIPCVRSLTSRITASCLEKETKKHEAIKWIVAALFVTLPCILINLPIYLFSGLNGCQTCSVQFPISTAEICEMIGLNVTACTNVIDLLSDQLNITEDYEDYEEYDLSGEEYNFTLGMKIIDENISNIAQMKACRYEEPNSFYAWLVSSFFAFYVFPTVVVVIFSIALCCKTAKSKTSNNGSKAPLMTFIFVLDILFLICWTPWHAIRMRKAYGGLGTRGSICASMLNYSDFFSLFFNVLAPVIYACMTGNFYSRLCKALHTTTTSCYRLLIYPDEYSEQDSADILLKKSERKESYRLNSCKEKMAPLRAGI